MKILKNKIIYIIIFLFLIAKFLTISNYKIVWWDSAVYIGMGKYIYSLGNAGLWEESRPIVWPLMLGFLWKIGLNAVLAGRILEIIFGSLYILLTYLISRKLFEEKTALLASVFLVLSPTFFFFNGIMLTEIISTFFSLLGIYFFIDKKYFSSGLFLGIAFMTRFLQLFVFVATLLVILIHFNKKNINNYVKILIGFSIIIISYLIFNLILYKNALFPFLQQIYLSQNTGWLNYHSISYYFIELFKENFLYLLSLVGFLLILKKSDMNKKLIAFSFILFFLFFNFIMQKEMRFLIILFPYMYLLVAFSIIYFIDKFKNKVTYAVIFFIIVSFVASIFTITTYYKNEINKVNQYALIQDKLEKASGKIWISSPAMSAFSDKKINKLMYYPLFNIDKKKELMEEIKNADFIFVDSCDLACKPFDKECENNKNELTAYFKQQLKTIYSSKINQCEQFIFQK